MASNLTQGENGVQTKVSESEEAALLAPLMRGDELTTTAAAKPRNEVVETHHAVVETHQEVVVTHHEVVETTTAPAAFGEENDATTTTPKRRKGSKNAGSKKGSKRVERPQSFWYRLCQVFEQGGYKSQIEFLRSPDSGEDISAAHRMHFSRAFKKYTNGTLANIEESRARKRKYEPLEQRVIEYWTQQQQQLMEENPEEGGESQSDGGYYDEASTYPPPAEDYAFASPDVPNAGVAGAGGESLEAAEAVAAAMMEEGMKEQKMDAPAGATGSKVKNVVNATATLPVQPPAVPAANKKKRAKKGGGKSSLAWSHLQQKAREWAKEMGLDDGFQASAGWIDNVLKRHQREVDARRNRLSIDATLAQRRSWANYSSGRAALEEDLLIADQVALLQAKGLKVGDRVTVMDVSQQAGDLVVTQISLPQKGSAAGGLKQRDSANTNGGNVEEQAHTYVTVERKRHGSTQSFPVTDVRKIVVHLLQEEDTATVRQLLEPRLGAFQAAIAHFPKSSPGSSRVIRPIWEENNEEHQSTTLKETTSVRIPLTDTSCAEKIDLHALRSQILPMFKRDHKRRVNLMEELQAMSQRSPVQQKVLEKLQFAQMTHDMAKDFLDDIADRIPTKGSFVVYQVDYQALDASMRGHLFAQTPAPVPHSGDSSKSYSPRPLTLQAMPEDLRNALVGQFAHLVTADQDIKADIFCSLADMAQVSNLIPAWRDYRSHTSAWCDFIQQTHEGISQDQAELLPRVLLQGGTYHTWKQSMDEQTKITVSPSDEAWTSLQTFVMRLENEWRILRDIVLTLPQYSWTKLDKAALLSSHDYAPAAIPNICMVRILQACEREVWTSVAHVLQSQGWVVRAKLIEGLLVESPSMTESLAAAMSVAETAIKSRGWDVVLMEGQCFGKYTGSNHNAPLPLLRLLRQARLAMEELQQSTPTEHTEEDNNVSLADDGAVALAKPEARNVNWNDNGTPKPHGNNATNDEMGGTEATKAELQMFAQL